MKKPALILILLLFAACAVGGYLAASKINVGGGNANDSQTLSTALAASQQNFLLVRVDDLSADSPQLIEAWAVFTAYSDPPQIMFMPLYPTYDGQKNKTLETAFGIGSNGMLTSRLRETISKQYNFSINGQIVIDSTGFEGLAGWLGISGLQVSSIPPSSEEDVHTTLLASQYFLQNVCAQLQGGQAMTQFNNIQWSRLLPAHFQTDLSFEHLMASWDRILHGSAPQQCTVLSNE